VKRETLIAPAVIALILGVNALAFQAPLFGRHEPLPVPTLPVFLRPAGPGLRGMDGRFSASSSLAREVARAQRWRYYNRLEAALEREAFAP